MARKLNTEQVQCLQNSFIVLFYLPFPLLIIPIEHACKCVAKPYQGEAKPS